ncbi:MAG: TolC family protein [Lacunisphaera sp.]
MDTAFPFKAQAKILAVLGVLVLAGCATNPKAALPQVQEAVGSRSGLTATWPQSESEKKEADRAVTALVADELTPESAVRIAVLNNRALRATFEDLGVSQADLIAASRLSNPSVSASVRWPDRRPRGPNAEFSVAADVLDGLLLPMRKKFARERLAQAERRVAHEVLALAAEVKIAAYEVEARQQFLARLAEIVDVNDAAADLAQRQYDAGNINRLELLNQTAAAQQAKLELMRTGAELRADRERLNRLLGLGSAQIEWKIASTLPALPEHEPSFDGFEDRAINQRLDLAAAKSEVTLAESAFNLKTTTRLLPISVNAGADTEREVDGTRVTGPRVELALPIFDQGQASLARLGAELRRAMDNYEGLSGEIRSEVREARDMLIAARATAEYYEQTLLPQRKLLLRETLLHYNAMQKSTYELLAAKERQLMTEREGMEALRDYWIARTQLEKALGGKLPRASEGPPAPKSESAEEAVPGPPHNHLNN